MTNKELNTNGDNLLQLVSFNLDKEEFGINILDVKEINRMTKITKLPNCPHYVEGIINLRSKVIPVIDLRAKLNKNKKEHDKNTRIIITEINEKSVGVIVDSVKEVIRISESRTEEVSQMGYGKNSQYIKSIGKLDDRLLILININKIINSHDINNIGTIK